MDDIIFATCWTRYLFDTGFDDWKITPFNNDFAALNQSYVKFKFPERYVFLGAYSEYKVRI